ncbi:MAG: hypothetical protein AAFY48_09165 [Bacteroidota bacterium]
MEEHDIKKELDAQDAPMLRAQQGRVPKWELPPGYLDQLADRALDQATAKPVTKFRRLQVVARWAVAAAVVLAAGLWWMSNQEVGTVEQFAELDWNSIPTEDLQQYVSDNIEEFDLDLLAEGARETAGSAVVPPTPADEISIEALEEFLGDDEEWLDDLESDEWF